MQQTFLLTVLTFLPVAGTLALLLLRDDDHLWIRRLALVTAVLNLDTSVVFLTPVLVYAARRRGYDEAAFLYAALLLSNAGSLLLPGSNLTNLIVLGHDRVSGARFAGGMAPAWVAAVVVTLPAVLVKTASYMYPLVDTFGMLSVV